MLFLYGLLHSHDPGLHPRFRPCVLGGTSIQSTVAIATPKHSEEHPYGSPVPGTLDALLSQRYYLAGARGLAGLPIPRPTS